VNYFRSIVRMSLKKKASGKWIKWIMFLVAKKCIKKQRSNI